MGSIVRSLDAQPNGWEMNIPQEGYHLSQSINQILQAAFQILTFEKVCLSQAIPYLTRVQHVSRTEIQAVLEHRYLDLTRYTPSSRRSNRV